MLHTEARECLHRSGYQLPPRERPTNALVRAAVCHVLSRVPTDGPSPSPLDIAARLYGTHDDRDVAATMLVRAAVDPAMTSVPEWAGELAQEAVADFMSLLFPVAILPQLASRGIGLDFGRSGSIRLPSRDRTPNLAGDFIEEGKPIPVKVLGLTSIAMAPRKLAVISTFSREMAQHSQPQIEQLIQNAMVEDTAEVLDARLIDDRPATNVRPAGLRHGVPPIAASNTGNPVADMMADLKALVGAILEAASGQRRAIVVLLNPLQALSMGLAQDEDGAFLFKSRSEIEQKFGVTFIDSASVPLGTLIAIDAADFASVVGTPVFDVSDQATLHMEDTAPLPIIDGTGDPPVAPAVPAFPTRSLWQTASIGVRMLWDVNWRLRRNGMIAWMEEVNW